MPNHYPLSEIEEDIAVQQEKEREERRRRQCDEEEEDDEHCCGDMCDVDHFVVRIKHNYPISRKNDKYAGYKIYTPHRFTIPPGEKYALNSQIDIIHVPEKGALHLFDDPEVLLKKGVQLSVGSVFKNNLRNLKIWMYNNHSTKEASFDEGDVVGLIVPGPAPFQFNGTVDHYRVVLTKPFEDQHGELKKHDNVVFYKDGKVVTVNFKDNEYGYFEDKPENINKDEILEPRPWHLCSTLVQSTNTLTPCIEWRQPLTSAQAGQKTLTVGFLRICNCFKEIHILD